VKTVAPYSTWRPSTPVSGCAPSLLARAARTDVPGLPAVRIRVRTSPVFAFTLATAGALKINNHNYIGIVAAAAAAAEGATTSLSQPVSAPRNEKVQGDMVKGGDARGIPPRGTPV